MEYTTQQIAEWKKKAEQWDELEAKIAKFYENEDGEYSDDEPESEGDLCDIGEIAAAAFGWL